MKCAICGKEFKNNNGLTSHIGQVHKTITLAEYYKTYISAVTSICECGTDCDFISLNKGFKNKCRNCRWTDRNKKISEKSKNAFKSGERKQWHEGLTKDTDKRLVQLGESISKTMTGRTKETYDHLLEWSKKQTGTNNTCFKQSEATKQRVAEHNSKIMKEKIAKGEFTPCITNSWANSRVKLTIPGFDNNYRSCWEAVFQILNPDCIYEKIRIPYMKEGNTVHTYITDFYDFKTNTIYEIKPEGFCSTAVNKLKFEAAKKYCDENNLKFVVITNEWFKENANKIDYTNLDPKIEQSMRRNKWLK